MSKYGNRFTPCQFGHNHDSAKEAGRCNELHLLEKGGVVTGLSVQIVFPLVVAGKQIGKYIADFVYNEGKSTIVEDVKGIRTALYRWKAKHFEAQYGYKIRET